MRHSAQTTTTVVYHKCYKKNCFDLPSGSGSLIIWISQDHLKSVVLGRKTQPVHPTRVFAFKKWLMRKPTELIIVDALI